MKRKLNVLVILAFFLFFILLVKAAEDESQAVNDDVKVNDLNLINEKNIQEITTENPQAVDLNYVNINNNIENSITHENIQKTSIENQEHHAVTASFGVYLNIVG